jgi:hypothetical protein
MMNRHARGAIGPDPMSDGYGRNPRRLRILKPKFAAKAVTAVRDPRATRRMQSEQPEELALAEGDHESGISRTEAWHRGALRSVSMVATTPRNFSKSHPPRRVHQGKPG